MAVEIVSRDIIKPSSPTPHHLKLLKLSVFDQVAPDIYVQLLFFYDPDHPLTPNSQKSLLLRSSLSQTLTRFYPFAGKMRDDCSIDCDDRGVDYAKARFSGELSKVLEKPHPESLEQFLPVVPGTATKGKLLVVQVTFFDDGGLAIGLGLSHKITDAPNYNVFLKSWGASSHNDEVIPLEFVMGSLYPAKESTVVFPMDAYVRPKDLVLKRFVFTASKLEQLQQLTGGTRVESVMALIWKLGITESKFTDKGHKKSSILSGAVDLRPRTRPPLGDSVVGNFTGHLLAKHLDSNCVPELHDLVKEMHRALEEPVERGVKDGWVLETGRIMELFMSVAEAGDAASYMFSSWSRMSVYDADFGCGCPVFVSPAMLAPKNCVILMSTRDGEGLEALITLESDLMNRFEQNKEMLAFASVDPPVLLVA